MINKYDKTLSWVESENEELKRKIKELEAKLPKNKGLKKDIIEGAKKYFIDDINNIESDGEKGDDTGFNENEGFNI